MSDKKLAQNQKIATAPKKDDKQSTILNRVKSINVQKVSKADIDQLVSNIIDVPDFKDTELAKASKQLVANCIKYSIQAQHPKLYKAFANMNYDELMKCVDKTAIHGQASDMLTLNIPPSALLTLPNADTVGLYGTSFSISPNSFWANITNILNEVSVGDNFINTGESFNAWEFYRDASLPSGEASLKTIGQTLSGVCLLNQNQLVPSNTQMLRGYQASLGVFINVDSAQDVGGGEGLGLFTMYSTPINVIKLAVTNPQQFAQMVRIFQATAMNSRDYSLWMITTYNLLNNITNIIVDNVNTNIRNCLNGTLFPAIQIMKNPTNEFNCGLIQTYTLTGSGSSASGNTFQSTNNSFDSWGTQITYDQVTSWTPSEWTNCQGTIRFYSGQPNVTVNSSGSTTGTPEFSNPYLVPGSNTYPRIQCSSAKDIHLIVSPEFFVGLKSGTLSQLFHWEYQRLEEYVPPENIHMLYKQINIPSGYLQDSNVSSGDGNTQGYAYNVYASLGDRWFPKNVIYLVTKPADDNQWTASYGWVWTTDMRNEWGAGMISTSFLHYAIYGGILPWSNGCCFYFKNLMNLVSDQTQAIMYNFGLGMYCDQTVIPPSQSTTGQN